MTMINIKNAKHCAFCKYWYDPTQSCITPRSPKINVWDYENSSRNICLQKNVKMPASASCNKYECKLTIM